MLKYRILTALIGIPLLLFLLYIGSIALFISVLVLFILGLREFVNIAENAGIYPIKEAMYVSGFLILLEAYFFRGEQAMFINFIVFLILVLQLLFQSKKYKISSLGISFLGVIYVGLLKYILLLRELPDGLLYIIFAFVLTWMVDTGAYFSGRRFGNSKLAPTISPNKTKEGALGGFITTIITALILSITVIPIEPGDAVIIGSLIGIFGQIGDLLESYLKRSANIKDSGQLLPGHGGVLDRFDSILLTVPVTYYYILLII